MNLFDQDSEELNQREFRGKSMVKLQTCYKVLDEVLHKVNDFLI